ncbi:hypothetical protein I6F15_04540 [Bradyrhizobium sp. BRP14]|nr:hypothetical protein [Bradyrhizobium sp. BRP14]
MKLAATPRFIVKDGDTIARLTATEIIHQHPHDQTLLQRLLNLQSVSEEAAFDSTNSLTLEEPNGGTLVIIRV